ncbi:MAG: hypothetical protein DRO99_00815 [Candidatus Aenigmatarchaeota archaeon]|nr:MAG: hypothetical protein DRO99_00815 [Candidatus Aenigmarchaeota archaeon]
MFTSRHHHHIEKILHLRSRLGKLYWHLLMQTFAVSLISVFMPIYLLTVGFSLPSVILFIIVQWAMFGLPSPLYGKVIRRIGLREVILIRTPLFAASMFILTLLESQQWHGLYLIAALLSGISGGLYTLSITSLFATYVGERKQNEKTAEFMAVPKMVSIIGPALGGAIVVFSGFMTLFASVMVIMLLSLIPLSFVKKNLDHPTFTLTFFRSLKFELRDFLFLNLYGIKTVSEMIILPVAVFIYSNDILSLGFLVSLISLCFTIVSIAVGKLSDRHGRVLIIRTGGVLNALIFLGLGLFLDSPMFVYLFLVSGFFTATLNVPYESRIYNHSRDSGSPIEYLAFKEFSFAFGRVLLLVVLLLSFSLGLAFYGSSLASLAFILF